MSSPRCNLCSNPSVYRCNCRNPPTPFCQDCSYVHHTTPGTHTWARLEQPYSYNIFCDVCLKRSATVVCCCKFPVTPLCVECQSEHERKFLFAEHFKQPIEKICKVKSLGDIQNAKKVLSKTNTIEAYLDNNIVAAAKLKLYVEVFASDLIAQIISAKEESMKEITKIERDIIQSRIKFRQEVEAHLFEVEARFSEELLREAFDTSKQFACTEMLQGEMCKDEPVGSRLVKLHIPQILRKHESCPICLDTIDADQRLKLSCGHTFHRDCVSDHFTAFISKVVKSEITCPKQHCGVVIPLELLQKVATPKDIKRYGILLLKAKGQLITCPRCGGGMSKEKHKSKLSTQVDCPDCRHSFCVECSQPWQVSHNATRCKFENIKRRIAELEQALEGGEDSQMAQCPGCKVPFLKDLHCAHVACPESACGVQWCFECSCLREPTMLHSNAWHRPQCKFWGPSDGSEKMNPKCPECQRLGRRCDPPPNLKVKQRFDLDEY